MGLPLLFSGTAAVQYFLSVLAKLDSGSPVPRPALPRDAGEESRAKRNSPEN